MQAWIGYDCRKHFYEGIPVNGTFTQHTFVTHPWRIRDAQTLDLIRDVPANPDENPTTVTLE